MKNLGIRVKILITIVILSIVVIMVGVNGILSTGKMESYIDTMQKDRLIPMKDLKIVADMYAVNIVDTAHKVRNGNISFEEGVNNMREAKDKISKSWNKYVNTTLTEKETQLVQRVKDLVPQRKALTDKLEKALAQKDKALLDEIVLNELYQVIDKISDRVSALIDLQLEVANEIHDSAEEEYETSKNIALSLIIIGLIVAIGISLYIANLIVTPVKDLNDKAKDLAHGDGDLTQRLEITSQDEIGRASIRINQFLEKVQNIIADIKTSATETASMSNELNATTEQIAHRVEDESKIINNNVKENLKIKDLLINVIDSASKSSDEIANAESNLKSSRGDIIEMVNQIQDSAKIELELSSKLNQLSQDAEQVKSVLTVIGDIADQTNLLALNAAIEAARAGEHGRGFAVVAENVRDLAEKTQKSLTEINSTISVIVQSIIDASEQMTINSNNIEKLAEKSSEVEIKINETSHLMENALNLSKTSLNKTNSVSESIQERMSEVENISNLSNSNARSVEEMVTAISHIDEMVENLNSKLNQFKS